MSVRQGIAAHEALAAFTNGSPQKPRGILRFAIPGRHNGENRTQSRLKQGQHHSARRRMAGRIRGERASLTNGCLGYFPTRDQCGTGGYEDTSSVIWFEETPAPLVPGATEKIEATALEMLDLLS